MNTRQICGTPPAKRGMSDEAMMRVAKWGREFQAAPEGPSVAEVLATLTVTRDEATRLVCQAFSDTTTTQS